MKLFDEGDRGLGHEKNVLLGTVIFKKNSYI